MKIIYAERNDAALIAWAVMTALGDELCESFTSENQTLEDVRRLFTACAESDDSQYSWKNALVAVDDNGTRMGVIVAYDGARLHELRKRFLDEFEKMHGFRIDEHMTDETSADEYYLDSLAVLPEYRGRGIAGKLIAAASRRGRETTGKRSGLLVDKTNHRAHTLYSKLGFEEKGERPFAGEMMYHMQLPE